MSTQWNAAAAAAAAKSLQSRPTLCDPTDSSPPGSSILGILQARTLEWVALSFSNACLHAKSLQSHPTLCDPMDGSPPTLLCPRDSLGKNTGVGCHFLLPYNGRVLSKKREKLRIT
ncbi:unnamed protein product [Rangifer tarandus platyrhynchus]|uniref:Uncharacterized protein n=2 Tax=Rangifer tarandus platyrhynchus TaxID=3082113 RepID=A0ACB1MJ66_RANTA|nr:unnamed protein product [Rangifer tarandus platyrhynchus]